MQLLKAWPERWVPAQLVYWHGLAIDKDVSVQSRKDWLHQPAVKWLGAAVWSSRRSVWGRAIAWGLDFTCKRRSAQSTDPILSWRVCKLLLLIQTTGKIAAGPSIPFFLASQTDVFHVVWNVAQQSRGNKRHHQFWTVWAKLYVYKKFIRIWEGLWEQTTQSIYFVRILPSSESASNLVFIDLFGACINEAIAC